MILKLSAAGAAGALTGADGSAADDSRWATDTNVTTTADSTAIRSFTVVLPIDGQRDKFTDAAVH